MQIKKDYNTTNKFDKHQLNTFIVLTSKWHFGHFHLETVLFSDLSTKELKQKRQITYISEVPQQI